MNTHSRLPARAFFLPLLVLHNTHPLSIFSLFDSFPYIYEKAAKKIRGIGEVERLWGISIGSRAFVRFVFHTFDLSVSCLSLSHPRALIPAIDYSFGRSALARSRKSSPGGSSLFKPLKTRARVPPILSSCFSTSTSIWLFASVYMYIYRFDMYSSGDRERISRRIYLTYIHREWNILISRATHVSCPSRRVFVFFFSACVLFPICSETVTARLHINPCMYISLLRSESARIAFRWGGEKFSRDQRISLACVCVCMCAFM